MRPGPLRTALLILGLLAASCAHDTPSPSGFHIESMDPADGAVHVDVSAAVTVTFSRDVHPDAVEGTHAILVLDGSNVIVNGTFSVSGSTVTFAPAGGFEDDETYGVAVREFVYDTRGASLRYPRAVAFSTGATVDPPPGFPPFDSHPLPPDLALVTAYLLGADVEVTGAEGAAEPLLHVNARNLTTGSAWVHTQARDDGSFSLTLPGGAVGDTLELSLSDPDTDKTGPAGTLAVLEPASWTELAPAGAGPSARYGHSAVYDPEHQRMIVFGGSTNAAGISASDQLFSLDLSQGGAGTWSSLSVPSGPSARLGHAAVYDPLEGRLLLFGGNTGLLGVLADVWVLTLEPGAEQWIPLAPLGTPPPARAFAAAAFDAQRNRLLVYGGEDASLLNPGRFDDLWALELSSTPAWVRLEASDPVEGLEGLLSFPPRSGAAALYDPSGQRLVMAFGHASVSGLPAPLPDAYALDLAADTPAWSALSPPASQGRGYAPASLDTLRNRLLVFGGRSTSAAFDDLFALDLASDAWSALEAPAGSPPSARAGHSAVWDAPRHRLLVLGGADIASGSVYADLHAFTDPP